jgi:hypothetical protein
MDTLHHTTVTKLTGYSRRMIDKLLKAGVIDCQRDRWGYPRFHPKVVKQLIARRKTQLTKKEAAVGVNKQQPLKMISTTGKTGNNQHERPYRKRPKVTIPA